MILGVQFLVSDLAAAFEATDHRFAERVLLYGNWER